MTSPHDQDSGGIILPDPDLPAEMIGMNGDGPPEAALIPHIFTGPTPGQPLAIVCDVFDTGEGGSRWVVMRIETMQGSTVLFLHPDVADNLANDLIDKAIEAKSAGPR